MKQNKNTYFKIYRVISLIIISVILLSYLSFSAFATPLNNLDFPDIPVTGGFTNTANSWDSSYHIFSASNARNIGIGNYTGHGFMTAFLLYSNNNYNVVFVSTSSEDSGTVMYYNPPSSYIVQTSQGVASHIYCNHEYNNSNTLEYTVYYGSSSWSYINTAQASNQTTVLPYYTSLENGLYDAYTYIIGHENEPPYEESPYYLSFSLNPGYVAFIDISDLTNVEVNLSTTLFSGSDWNNHTTDQNIGVLTSLPSSFSLPIAGTSHISWSGYGNTNILGQYKSFHAPYTYTTAGSGYLCIVNPLQARQSAQLTAMASMPSARNNPINVSVSLARAAKIYSLTATLDIGSGTLDTESNGSTNSGSPDAEGQWQWNNDQTGQPIDPNDLPIGGGNDPIIGQETSINDWLQDIANQIKGFFSGAIGAVTTLVSAGSAFINSLVSLYSWLPGSVYAVLSSALILVITIGVIKVFI